MKPLKPILLTVLTLAFIPYPTTVTHSQKIQVVDELGHLISGVQVTHYYQNYTVQRYGQSDVLITDSNGTAVTSGHDVWACFARRAYGVSTKLFNAHASYGPSEHFMVNDGYIYTEVAMDSGLKIKRYTPHDSSPSK